MHRCAELVMANQVPVVPDVQQLQDAFAVPPAQAGAAQNQAQDAQNVDGGEQPAAVCDNMCFICTSGGIGGMWPIMPRGLSYVGVVPAMLL